MARPLRVEPEGCALCGNPQCTSYGDRDNEADYPLCEECETAAREQAHSIATTIFGDDPGDDTKMLMAGIVLLEASVGYLRRELERNVAEDKAIKVVRIDRGKAS